MALRRIARNLAASLEKFQARQVRFNHEGEKPMTRLIPWSAAAAAACSVAFLVSSVSAQTTPSNCGGERWSQAEMRYVAVPCAAPATKTADGKDDLRGREVVPGRNALRRVTLFGASDEDCGWQRDLRGREVVPGRNALRHVTLRASIIRLRQTLSPRISLTSDDCGRRHLGAAPTAEF